MRRAADSLISPKSLRIRKPPKAGRGHAFFGRHDAPFWGHSGLMIIGRPDLGPPKALTAAVGSRRSADKLFCQQNDSAIQNGRFEIFLYTVLRFCTTAGCSFRIRFFFFKFALFLQ